MKEGKIYEINIDEIEFGINPKKFNPNSEEHLEELKRLAKLINQYGQIQPIDITPYYKNGGTIIIGRDALTIDDWAKQKKKFLRLDGERRARAMRDVLKMHSIKSLITLRLKIEDFVDAKWLTCAKKVEINPLDMAIAIDEFKHTHDDLTDSDVYKKLSELTGYSTTFFLSRDDINDASDELKKMIEKYKTKANVMTEIKRNIPDKFLWRIIAEEEHIKGGDKVSTLSSRVIKPILKRAINDFEGGEITEEELNKQGISAIKNRGMFPTKKYENQDFHLYNREIRDFIYKVKCWNIGDKSHIEHHKKLSSLFSELNSVWDIMLTEIYPGIDRRTLFTGHKIKNEDNNK